MGFSRYVSKTLIILNGIKHSGEKKSCFGSCMKGLWLLPSVENLIRKVLAFIQSCKLENSL